MDLSTLSLAERSLHYLAVEKSKKYRFAEVELLRIVAAVDHSKFFKKLGFASCYAYCEKVLQLSEYMICALTAVARKSREVPELQEGLEKGRFTLAKAARIACVITPENKHEWLEKAEQLTKAMLEKEIAKANPKMAVHERATYVAEDRLKLELGVDEATMELLRRAQDLLSSKKQAAASFEDTLHASLLAYLEKHDPLEKAKRQRKSKPDTSDIPASEVHAVNLRDKGQCQARNPDGSLCLSRRWTHLHHKKPRAEGGAHTMENLITLCQFHHQQIHRPAQARQNAEAETS